MSVSGAFGVGRGGGFGRRRSQAFGGRSGSGPTHDLEAGQMPEGRKLVRRANRLELRKALQREAITEILPELPADGVSVHIISNAKYDFWTWCPHLLDLLGEPADMWASTWTLNRQSALDMLALLDAGRIRSLLFTTGLYFKRRETSTYATLVEGLLERGQRYVALTNHAKVLVLRTPTVSIVVEGSANFTANPRLEQYVVTRSHELAAFHAGWMIEAAG